MQIYLSSPESKIRVKDGLFEVSWYDQEGRLQKNQHAPSLIESIWLHEGAVATVAALRLAMLSNIDVVICDRYGDPEGRLLGFKPSTTSMVQKAQALVSISPAAMEYARGWVVRKLITQVEYLEKLGRRRTEAQRRALEEPIRQINHALKQIQEINLATTPKAAAAIRGWEGGAGKAFYSALAMLIPEKYRFDGRSRRPAKDPFNAFLNYAFAILYRKVERALIKVGLNPYIGFMHRDGYQFRSIVFDFIEPYRTDMVRAVFSLFARQFVKPTIHTIRTPEGAIRLTKEGKGLLIKKIGTFYEKKAQTEGLSMSRDKVLEKEAQRFAFSLISTTGLEKLENTSLEEIEEFMLN